MTVALADRPKLDISEQLELPPEAVTQTFAILAKRGTGKSNAARVTAEQMYHAGYQWVAIDPKGDWYGLRSNRAGDGPGLEIPVFGGDHGDMPLAPTSGAFMAELIVKEGLTCILDVSDFDTKAEQIRFLTDFGLALYKAAKKARRPIHLFLEEADEFLPQQVGPDMARCVGIWTKIVKLGRTHGLGATIITQRSASINKGALTQIDTLIIMRTTSSNDRKVIREWLQDEDDVTEILATLTKLAAGEAWVWSPHFLGGTYRIRYRLSETFDSGATPVAGAEPRPAPRLADIDLGAIKAQMEEAVAEVLAMDPKHLQKRIDELEKLLDGDAAAVDSQEVAELRARVGRAEAEQARLERELQQAAERSSSLGRRQVAMADALAATAEQWRLENEAMLGQVAEAARPDPTAVREPSAPAPAPEPPRARSADTDEVWVPNKRSGAFRIIDVAARLHPAHLTRPQVSRMANITLSGGTAADYWTKVVRHGYIAVGTDGTVECLAKGFELTGRQPRKASSPPAMREMWHEVLSNRAGEIMELLLCEQPRGLTNDQIAVATGLTASGGTFSGYLSELKNNGIAVRNGDRWFLVDELV